MTETAASRDPSDSAAARLWRTARAFAARAWRALGVGWDAALSFNRHEGVVLAGYVAYAGLLAIFPFLIFAFAFAAATTGPAELEALVDLLFEFAPDEVAAELEPVLRNVLAQRGGGGLLTFAGLAALWASSSGVEAFRTAFDRAYEVETPRHVVLRRLIGLALVLVGAVSAAVLGFAVVLAPLMMELASTYLGLDAPLGIGVLRYVIAVLALTVFLYLMHLMLPSRPPRVLRLWPGIVATIAIWTAAASAFSFYLALAPSFSATYGALSGVIVTLLFFFLSGAVIIYGAEINAALARREAEERSRGEEP